MSQALAKQTDDAGAAMERVIIVGDLAKLEPGERVSYYNAVCKSVGLNPFTRPLEYIQLNGKLTLYARKDATEQLREIHNVSILDLIESERDGVFIVTAKAINGKGRTDIAKGAVHIASLKGEALANALMKAETKAKRRVTLSICGLGFLDETEIETIPQAQPVRVTEQGEIVTQPPAKVFTLSPAPTVVDADSEPTPTWVRELARLKGIDIDKSLEKQRKPKLEDMPVESLRKVYGWIQQAPNAPTEAASAPQEASEKSRTPAQQKIRLFWDELKYAPSECISSFNQYIESKDLDFNHEVFSETDIPDGIGNGFASYLANLVAKRDEARKDDPLI